MTDDAPVTREEFNRLRDDMQALRLLITHDVGTRWDREYVKLWHHAAIVKVEQATTNEVTRSGLMRALDALALMLRAARGNGT